MEPGNNRTVAEPLRMLKPLRARCVYEVALKIEELAFWLGWRVRLNGWPGWASRTCMRSADRLKALYFSAWRQTNR